VRLAAEGVVLRAYEERDVPAIIAMLEDAETKIWNPTKGPLDLAAAEMAADGAMWTGERHTPWAIADASDDRYLGGVVLHAIDHRQFDAEVGYTIVPRARGRGVASRAVRMAAEYGFDALGLVRIELLHAVGNVASCRVAERAGFVLEGTLRSAYIYGDGQRHDEHTHARLADDPDSSSAADLRGQ
jgi:RimJ/RimL family protein N-acetyltransferase